MVHIHPFTDKFQVIASNPVFPCMFHTHTLTDKFQVKASDPYIPLYGSRTTVHGQIPSNSI